MNDGIIGFMSGLVVGLLICGLLLIGTYSENNIKQSCYKVANESGISNGTCEAIFKEIGIEDQDD